MGIKFKFSPNSFLYRALPYGRHGEILTRKFKGKGKKGLTFLLKPDIIKVVKEDIVLKKEFQFLFIKGVDTIPDLWYNEFNK